MYIERPFKEKKFKLSNEIQLIEHIQNIRIGTKSISFWPHRYITDEDADDLLDVLRELVSAGKHVAIMTHFNHWREMETPMAIEAILDKLDVSPSECVMVGDSIFDAEAAHRAGVDFIGVESGAYSGEELPHTSQVFPSITELAEALESSRPHTQDQNQEGETLAWI